MKLVQGAATPATRCPLCGEDNRCAMAEPSAEHPCWCTEVRFPEDLLTKSPDPERCICRACLERATSR